MKRFLAVLFLIALSCAIATHAQSYLAYTDGSTAGGDAGPNNFALTFQVNSPIDVTALGVFDFSNNGTINGPVYVAIYQDGPGGDAGALVTPVVTFAGTGYTLVGSGYDVIQSITPVTLGPGDYLVDEWGLNANGDLSGNQAHSSPGPTLNTGGGLLTFTGAVYDGNGSIDNPFITGDSCIGCYGPDGHSSQFDAGTFEFHADVPEGSASWLYMLLTAGACGGAGFVKLRNHFATRPPA